MTCFSGTGCPRHESMPFAIFEAEGIDHAPGHEHSRDRALAVAAEPVGLRPGSVVKEGATGGIDTGGGSTGTAGAASTDGGGSGTVIAG